jgi:hypothetical protein
MFTYQTHDSENESKSQTAVQPEPTTIAPNHPLQQLANSSQQVSQLQTVQELANHRNQTTPIQLLAVKQTDTSSPAVQETSSETAPVQRKSIKLEAEGITENMQDRFATAYSQFESKILSKSYLAQGDNNQVLIYGVSQKTLKMKDYGATTIYLGNGEKNIDDYQNFTELWGFKTLEKDVPKDVPVRIVITINLTINKSVEEIYSTLLHEWYVHAVNWEGVVKYIRAGMGNYALPHVQGQGHEKRGKQEHMAFATMKDEQLEQMTDNLGLVDKQKEAVLSKLQADRNRHDKDTGEV